MWFEDPEPGSRGRCLPFSVVTHSWSCVGPSARKAKALRAGVSPWRGFSLRDTLTLPLGDLQTEEGHMEARLGCGLLHWAVPELWGLFRKCLWRNLKAEATLGTRELKEAEEREWGF